MPRLETTTRTTEAAAGRTSVVYVVYVVSSRRSQSITSSAWIQHALAKTEHWVRLRPKRHIRPKVPRTWASVVNVVYVVTSLRFELSWHVWGFEPLARRQRASVVYVVYVVSDRNS
jgi:hypothetical protein